ncbi:MAG: type VI secretion system accessory protein TagJ [Phycisphaerales bacterium]
MDARTLVREGKPSEALAALQEHIRSSPAGAADRIFLFQLLSVLGQWDRALTQLNVAAEMEPKLLLAAQLCRPALACEALREEIFTGRRSPLILGEPQPWVGWMVEALALSGRGDHAGAAALRAKALEEAPAVSGLINDQRFEWIADADPRLGPIIEAVIEGKYYWVPFPHVSEVLLEPPTDLRDAVWTQAQFIWTNGGHKVGLIPTRYAGTASAEDGALRLARRTDWLAGPGGEEAPIGQRLFATDAGEFPILETRRIALGAAAEQAPAEGGGTPGAEG